MPLDSLEHPLAALTDHRVLSTEEEAALIEQMLAGVHARAMLPSAPQDAVAATCDQALLGEQARATLVRHNLRLVVAIAKRYRRVAGDHLSLEDLISSGAIGLLQGIDKFDPQKTGKLSTYVTWWIRQAIARGIHEEGRLIALPVHLHERLAAQRRTRSRLVQQLQREPTADELAAALAWSSAKVASVAADLLDAGSLNVRAGGEDDGSELGELLPDTRFDPEATALSSSLRQDIEAALVRVLSEREYGFVRAHFGFDTGEKATLEAIALSAGLTRERVRQVIVGALHKLRNDPVIASYQPSPAA